MIRIEVDTPEEKLHVYCDRFVQMKYSISDEYLSRFDAVKQALRHDPDVVLIEK